MDRFQDPGTEEPSPANVIYKSKGTKPVERLETHENVITSRNQTGDLIDIQSGHEFTLSKKEEFFNLNNKSPLSKRSRRSS